MDKIRLDAMELSKISANIEVSIIFLINKL